MNWFKVYKTYEGKKPNSILFDSKILDLQDTIAMIKEAHEAYRGLISGNKKRKEPFWLDKRVG